MSMSNKKCCVPGCLDSGGSHKTLHTFPHPERDRQRFNTWIYSIGGNILGLSNQDIYKNRRVCHAHFEEKFCCRNSRISNIAIPTLQLPGSLSLPRFSFEESRPAKYTKDFFMFKSEKSALKPVENLPDIAPSLPKDAIMHRFPSYKKFPERFKAWVSVCGGKPETALDYEYYMNKRVCDNHFTIEDHNRNNRLNAMAVPKLNLSGESAAPAVHKITESMASSTPIMGEDKDDLNYRRQHDHPYAAKNKIKLVTKDEDGNTIPLPSTLPDEKVPHYIFTPNTNAEVMTRYITITDTEDNNEPAKQDMNTRTKMADDSHVVVEGTVDSYNREIIQKLPDSMKNDSKSTSDKNSFQEALKNIQNKDNYTEKECRDIVNRYFAEKASINIIDKDSKEAQCYISQFINNVSKINEQSNESTQSQSIANTKLRSYSLKIDKNSPLNSILQRTPYTFANKPVYKLGSELNNLKFSKLVKDVPEESKEQENIDTLHNEQIDMDTHQYEDVQVLEDIDGDTFYNVTPEGPFSWQKDETAIPCVDDDEALVPPSIMTGEVTSQVEEWLRCNECQQLITGMRFVCLECADCELCPQCEEKGCHATHYVLRAPQGALTRSVQAMVVAARRALAETQILLNEDTEIKSETEEPTETEDPFSFCAPPSRLSSVADACTTNPTGEPILERDSDDDISYVPDSHSDDSNDTEYSEYEHRKRRKHKSKQTDDKDGDNNDSDDGHNKEYIEHDAKRRKHEESCEDNSEKLIHLSLETQDDGNIVITSMKPPEKRICSTRRKEYFDDEADSDSRLIDVSDNIVITNDSSFQSNTTPIYMHNTNSQVDISRSTDITGLDQSDTIISQNATQKAPLKKCVIQIRDCFGKPSLRVTKLFPPSETGPLEYSDNLDNNSEKIISKNSTLNINNIQSVPLNDCYVQLSDCFGNWPQRHVTKNTVPVRVWSSGSQS